MRSASPPLISEAGQVSTRARPASPALTPTQAEKPRDAGVQERERLGAKLCRS